MNKEEIRRHNTRRWTLWIALALVAALLLPALGQAQSGPNTMNFQGRLLDEGGNPRGGETHCMRFRLCSDSLCTTQVWPMSGYEYQAITTASGTYKAGLFTATLGLSSPIPPTLMYDYDTLYLEIGVADEGSCPGNNWTTMLPRSPLRANAYAQRSRRVRPTESDDDYLVSMKLVAFGVEARGGAVVVYWETATEMDNLGFHLYRSEDGQPGTFGRLNQGLIPSQAPGGGAGACYEWVDATAMRWQRYYYLLEDVNVYGQATPHGPVAWDWPGEAVFLPLIAKP